MALNCRTTQELSQSKPTSMSDTQNNEKRENTGVLFLDKVREFTNDKGEKVVSLSGLGDITCPNCKHEQSFFINAYPALGKNDPSKPMYRFKFKPKERQAEQRAAGPINAPGFEHLNQPTAQQATQAPAAAPSAPSDD
jgi:hypothetical protein